MLEDTWNLEQWSKEEEAYWQRYLDFHGVDFSFFQGPGEDDEQNDFQDDFTDKWNN